MRTNEEIINLIVSLRKEKGISLSELARRIGISKSTLSRYENKSREFPVNNVQDFANALNVEPEYLLGVGMSNNSSISHLYNQLTDERKKNVYNYAEQQLEQQLKEQNKVIDFPLVGSTAAGSPLHYSDPCEETIEVTNVPHGANFALAVRGDSMEPLIKDEDIIFVKEQPTVENGEIAVVEIDHYEVTCKKVHWLKDGKLELVSLNSKYSPIYPDGWRIIGKVILSDN